MKHSISLVDFVKKAKQLNVEIDFSGKYTTYRLMDFEQERPIRDSSLISKRDQKQMEQHPEKRIFSKGQIELRCEKNAQNSKIVLGEDEILEVYHIQQKWFQDNSNIKLVIEPWQIESVQNSGIRVHIEAGYRKGTIKFEQRQIEKVGENFEVYLNTFSKFQFLDDTNQKFSAILRGGEVIRQLSNENDRVPVRQNYGMNYVHNLFEATNLLSRHGITGRESFQHLGEDFIADMENVEQALETLDEKILIQTDRVKFNQSDHKDVEQLQNLQKERGTLESAYQKITDDLEIYDQLEQFQKQPHTKPEQENHPNVKR